MALQRCWVRSVAALLRDGESSAGAEWASEALRSLDKRTHRVAALRAFAQSISYALRIRGTHPSGIAYEELLRILAEQGRDFTADSRRLRDHVAYALVEQFGSDQRAPGTQQLRQIAAAAILEWVLARIESGQRDVPIKANAAAYRAWKRRNAAYSRVGMKTGALRDALRDKGRVAVR